MLGPAAWFVHVCAHLLTPRSIPDHSQNRSILSRCDWISSADLPRMARSSANPSAAIVCSSEPGLYPAPPTSSHRSSTLRKILNNVGLRISPWIVPALKGIGGVFFPMIIKFVEMPSYSERTTSIMCCGTPAIFSTSEKRLCDIDGKAAAKST